MEPTDTSSVTFTEGIWPVKILVFMLDKDEVSDWLAMGTEIASSCPDRYHICLCFFLSAPFGFQSWLL